MKKIAYFLVFLVFAVLLFGFCQTCLAQISTDTVNGWYIVNTTGSVNIAYSRLVKDTAAEGQYSQSFYHSTTIATDFGEVWYEKKLDVPHETRKWFVISAQIRYIEPRIHSDDGVTFYLFYGNADTMIQSGRGGVLGVFDLFLWHEFGFEVFGSPITFNRLQLRMFNTVNRSEILFDDIYISNRRPERISIDRFGDGLVEVDNNSPHPPLDFSLSQNYPNPFNAATNIKFRIMNNESGIRGWVKLVVYDVLGREVAILVNGEIPAGEHSATFIPPAVLPSGIYLYKLQAGKFSETKKMILLK